MLELFDKDFKAAITNMLQNVRVNPLEMAGMTEWWISHQGNRNYKEPNKNFRPKNRITKIKTHKMSSVTEWKWKRVSKLKICQ